MNQTPKPPNPHTAKRWKENRRRRRMLEGEWRTDLQDRIAQLISNRRASIWGEPDTAKNLARSIVGQLATLYNRPASPLHEQDDAAMMMREVLAEAGHWQILQGFSPLVIGMREGLVRCDVVSDPVSRRPQLLTRVVPADLVHVEAHPDEPDEPVRVYEYRIRQTPKGPAWSRDAWDVSDPANPFFEIQDEEGNGWPDTRISGDDYLARWSYADGVPFIPGEWYHASRTGKIDDALFGVELFDGALTVAALWTFFGHIIRDASWPQRYMVNARVTGVGSNEGEGTPYVEMDPSAVLMAEPVEPGIAVIVGQFAAGGDPQTIGQSIRDYAADLASDFDISPSDIQRATGDARSGYAVELTKEGMRTAQQRYAMSFGRHDSALIGKIAAMLARAGVADLPDSGWRVEYAGIPLGLSERAAQLDELRAMLEMGLISRPEALARIEAIPVSEARKRLEESQTDRARFSA